ncbi:P-loop containing nucleoside triphosphate hydrolase protein [Cladochytrium replicatum]|nr:P-loop containing nucleoside triphosphate hydrolase protein [Cladochytrium replicatum]
MDPWRRTPHELLLKTPVDLQATFHRKLSDVTRLLADTARTHLQQNEFIQGSALELLTAIEGGRKLSVGDPVLDATLQGGLSPGILTEITGPSGSGKTQLALQMCVMVQLPSELGGLDAGAVYISTEQMFPSNRLFSIVNGIATRLGVELDPDSLGSNIFILHVRDHETQNHILSYQLPVLLSNHRIRLVILDSVTATFRGFMEDTTTALADPHQHNITPLSNQSLDPIRRAQLLYELAASLKRTAAQFGAVVLCTNQVAGTSSSASVFFERQDGTEISLSRQNLESGWSGITSDSAPALGMTWANMVNMRVMLDRGGAVCGPREDDVMEVERTMAVHFSPYIPEKRKCHFVIDGDGVKGLER